MGRKNPTPSSISNTELIDDVVPLNANEPLCFSPNLNLDYSSTSWTAELLAWSRVRSGVAHAEAGSFSSGPEGERDRGLRGERARGSREQPWSGVDRLRPQDEELRV